jgi:putative RNA 2'-phosphotransferase
MRQDLVKLSKFLSLVLRHQPEKIGLKLDEAGWVAVSELMQACNAGGFPITRSLLEEVVQTNDKKRFAFSDDGLKIRASQGHSVEVELAYAPLAPPEILYHGTATRFLDSIKEQGLLKGQRHQVHLSADRETAVRVGARHGEPVVLVITSGQMHTEGFLFYLSENRVWLTDHVPPRYIKF